MSDLEVTVQIDSTDLLVGRLFTSATRGVESSTFEYDASYLASSEAYSIDPLLPLSSGASHTTGGRDGGRSLFNAFSDSTPDRWGQNLMRRAERDRAALENTTARTLLPSDLLLSTSDVLRQGALRFRHRGSTEFLAADTSGVPKIVALPDLIRAADALGHGLATDEDILDLLQAGGSLGGARPKAAVIDREGRLCIAKFPKSADTEDWNVIGWEKTALDLAGAAGINAAKGSLVAVGQRSTLVLPRFDRVGDASTNSRIGYMSALTALEASDGDQTQSYLDIVNWIEENSSSAESDAQELWRRMAFSITIGNTDDHLRNHGFLRGTNGWRLSPAFDVNPTPGTHPKSLSTAISRGNNSSELGAALEVAELFALEDASARKILGEIGAALSGWRRRGQQNNLSTADLDLMGPTLEQGRTNAEILASSRSTKPAPTGKAKP